MHALKDDRYRGGNTRRRPARLRSSHPQVRRALRHTVEHAAVRKGRYYAGYVRKYALELPLIADDDIHQWATSITAG